MTREKHAMHASREAEIMTRSSGFWSSHRIKNPTSTETTGCEPRRHHHKLYHIFIKKHQRGLERSIMKEETVDNKNNIVLGITLEHEGKGAVVNEWSGGIVYVLEEPTSVCITTVY